MTTQEQPDPTQGFDWGAPSTAPPPPGDDLWSHTEDIACEQKLLCAMILDGDTMGRFTQEMEATEFSRVAHRLLFSHMRELSLQRRPFDLVVLVEDLRKSGGAEAFGGVPYLLSITEATGSWANAPWYAERVRAAARKRQLAEGALRLLDGIGKGEDLEAVERRAEEMIHAASPPPEEHTRTAGELLLELTARIEERAENPRALLGIPSGLRGLDAKINGLQAPDLFIVGARPGSGKSALLTTVAAHVARRGDPVLLFSMEMNALQVMTRLACADARIDAFDLRSARLSPAEYERYFAAVTPLYGAPLEINDMSGATPGYLRAQIRRFLRKHGRLALVGIDYLQLMTADGKPRDRFQELSEISRQVKMIAREFSVPIMALAQLSRGVESRDNKRPVLSDLRETGQLEQDADIVGFLYREDLYAKPGAAPSPSVTETKPVELLIRKHRNGPLGTVHLDFVDQFTLFMDGEGPT